MAKEKVDRNPDQKGGIGREKDEAEVAGRGKKVLHTCYNCGSGNYVDSDWKWFTCWKCGTLFDPEGVVPPRPF